MDSVLTLKLSKFDVGSELDIAMEIPQAKHGYARDSIGPSKLVNPPWRSKELNKVVVEDQKSKRKTIKTLLTEALAQLRSERCRIFKWIGKFNAIM